MLKVPSIAAVPVARMVPRQLAVVRMFTVVNGVPVPESIGLVLLPGDNGVEAMIPGVAGGKLSCV